MARRIRETDLRAIEDIVGSDPDGRTARQIAEALEDAPAHRTLQYRIRSLVDGKRLTMEGAGREARYRVPRAVSLGPVRATVGPFKARAQLTVSCLSLKVIQR